MNSKSPLPAIIGRLKASPTKHDWIRFAKAVAEISEAFGIRSEAASMTLYGLVATGIVQALDKAGKFINLDTCTITELEGKPEFVSTNELRSWLREWSAAPTVDRDRVIEKKLRGSQIPGRNIDWKKFCDEVRDGCNGWRAKGRPAWGFSDKQIQRVVNELRSK
jgi:hypothetical protein